MKLTGDFTDIPLKKYVEERPWGKFERFTHEQLSTVKIISISPGQAISLQYHKKREEFWRIIAGFGQVILDGETFSAEVGDEFYIRVGREHRLIGGDNGIQALEIGFGDFDEDDIVREEDNYNRT